LTRRFPIILSIILPIILALIIITLPPAGSPATAAPSTLPAGYATLNDYWNGTARWSFVRNWTEVMPGWSTDDDFSAGSHITAVQDPQTGQSIWYAFTRKWYSGQLCTFGPGHDGIPGTADDDKTVPMGTRVRKSTDKGVTWTAPVDIIIPTAGTPWACAGTDGDAYYDAPRSTWHYLFQCLGNSGGWKGCHLQRPITNPLGLFLQSQTPHANPVINGKDLWSRICNQSQDNCVSLPGGVNRVYDEGTFNIFKYDGTSFWVGFHGYDGVRGYRGIAKTTNFVTWVAGDPNQGVPGDAMLDLRDASGWRETWNSGGPVGAGAGSILYENGYYYQISEFMDINLGCTHGQNWDWGMFRSTSLTNTTWSQYPFGNPIFYSSKAPEGPNGKSLWCNLQYARLFQDPVSGISYLTYGRRTNDKNFEGIYLYELKRTSNILKNGDLWMGNGSYWQRYPIGPTNLVVYRYPNNSPDGTNYLATNCGTNPNPCQPGQSIYQDVNVSALNVGGKDFGFGGMFATDSGNGVFTLAVFQMDQNYNVLQTNSFDVYATPTYAGTQSGGTFAPGTKIVRYQIYPKISTITFRADQMYVSICDPVCYGP
jgi:hypothetical protein